MRRKPVHMQVRPLPNLTVCPGFAPENIVQAVFGRYRGYVIQPPESARATTDGQVVPVPSDNRPVSRAARYLIGAVVAILAVIP